MEIIAFLYLDKANYLHKGISIKKYEILPFYTEIEGDHNSSGFFTFTPTRHNGLRLETTLIFNNNKKYEIPTLIYTQLNYNSPDTIFLSRIISYGYNEKDLVVKTETNNNAILWLQPVWHNQKIHIIQVDEKEINMAVYKWVTPMSACARLMIITWLFLLVSIPISILCELYWIVFFGANGKNGEVGMEGDDGYRLGSKGNLEKSAVFANYGERLRSGLYSILSQRSRSYSEL